MVINDKVLDDLSAQTKAMETYHTHRVFSTEEFKFAMDMLDTYPWIKRDLHRRGFDEMIDRLVLDDKERDLLAALLRDFVYVDVDECEDLLQSIIEQLQKWGCNKENTVIVAINKRVRENDGSVIFLKQLEDRLYGWKKRNFQVFFDYRRKFRSARGYKKVVLIDDFIGSGKTMAGRLKEIMSVMAGTRSNIEIYVVALAGLAEAKHKFPELNDRNVYVPLWLNNAFDRTTDHEKTKTMDIILERLNKKNNNGERSNLDIFGYGYKNSAGLYYNVHYRIPNNVLAMFWWGCFKENKDTYHSMFRRS